MKRLHLACLPLLALTALTGCQFWKKSSKPKENPAIATEVEAKFKQRWLDKRTTELKASGLSAAAAQARAEAEFDTQYSFTSVAK